MDLIADMFLAAGAIGAAIYCLVLGKRLQKFNSLENGVGGAVAVLSSQVEDLKKTLETAQSTAAQSTAQLEALHARAEDVSKRLEIQLAALNDLPSSEEPKRSADVTELREGGQSEPMFMRHAAGGRG